MAKENKYTKYFVEIQNTLLDLFYIQSIECDTDFTTEGDIKYTIVINKTGNDKTVYANKTFSYFQSSVRDAEYEKLKQYIQEYGNVLIVNEL